MASPYPWHYDLRWPWLHLRPSLRAHVDLPRRPLAARFASARTSMRVVMFGDLMGLAGDRCPSASRAVQDLFGRADLIIGNCEAPVVREHNDPEARYLATLSLGSQYLRDFFARFEADPTRCVLSVANNHAGDSGAAGLRETEARLGALGVQLAGVRDGAPAPLVVREAGPLRIGIAAWSTWMNKPLGGEATVPGPSDIAAIDWRVRRRVLALDTILATPHWEWEFQHVPQPDTVAIARGLAAAGVDAIAGHHPHVIQPLAYLGEAARPSVCAFSLGNLFARTVTWPHRLGALLELELSTEAGPERGRVVAYRLHPTVQTGDGDRTRVVALAEAPARLRERIEERLARLFETREPRSSGASCPS
ncbi:MAG TPA: CapA family protein [Kofleriaceae bacterium]|nr:CapA family protein [Kofleriaceae bacterium]